MQWCALLTAVQNYNKSLEKLQDFFLKTETKTECSRPGRDQNFHFCPRGASRPRPWSRGLHHWKVPTGNFRSQERKYRGSEKSWYPFNCNN